MRAIRVTNIQDGTMELADVPDPQPGADAVVVNVEAAAVGFVDTLVVAGKYQNASEVPFTPGMEFAGTVAAVGSGLKGTRVGDRVVAYVSSGAFAERAAAEAGTFFPVPDDVPLAGAVLLCGAYLTAFAALVARGQFTAGDTVLVGGAGGGVGLAAVQLARALGAKTIVGTYRTPADRDAVLSAGADVVFDASVPDLRDALHEQVVAVTDGRGVDVVVDPLGGDFFPAALRCLAWSGRIVVVGFAGGSIPTVRTNHLLMRNVSVAGLDVTSYRKREPERLPGFQARIFDLWREGLLKPRVARTFRLEEASEALAFVARGRAGGRALLSFERSAA